MKEINSDLCHLGVIPDAERKLAFSADVPFEEWREKVREKFEDLFGISRIRKNICDLNVAVEEEVQMEGYRRIRFTFESEKGAVVPCYLLIPDDACEKPYPVAITLQGHSSGFHNSVGIIKSEKEREYQLDRGMFGVQAVENGYACLCLEQRGMGESRSNFRPCGAHICVHTAMTAILLGRTVLGERAWDVSRAIDALEFFRDRGLDLEHILITGNSGGGTTSFYAACLDERIGFCAPSCSFCSYESSILSVHHCECNYVPDIMNWFEMGDLACLIAPRPLTAITGGEDTTFPPEGARSAMETAKAIYKAAGAPEACRLIETPKGHWWCKEIVWPAINEKTKEMGWK